MKILLVQPRAGEFSISDHIYMHEPLALEYVGAGVSDTYETRILDMRIDNNLLNCLENYKPDIVGFTGFTIHVNTVRKLCMQVKEFNPSILTVVGGHHATILPEDYFIQNVDIIVIGEGVIAFREVVDSISEGRDLRLVDGLAIRQQEHFVYTQKRNYPHLDSIPLPDRKLTEHYRNEYFSEWFRDMASVRTSKGCPFRCSFCSLWRESKGKYRTRDPQSIVDELLGIEEQFVFFSDDESFIDLKRSEKLANLIIESGIKKSFFMYVRSDTVNKNPEIIEKWGEAGLSRVLIGMESHKDEDLKKYNKNNTALSNETAVKTLHEMGISIYAAFIINQNFVEEDFDGLADYVRRLKIETPYYSVLTPLPGSQLYDEVKDKLISYNYDFFDFCHTVLPTALPLNRFYNELYNLYLKTYRTKNIATNIDYALSRKFSESMHKIKNAYSHYK